MIQQRNCILDEAKWLAVLFAALSHFELYKMWFLVVDVIYATVGFLIGLCIFVKFLVYCASVLFVCRVVGKEFRV